MDDTPWSFVIEVAVNWWYSSTYFYRIDGPVKENYPFIQPESIIKLKNKTEAVEETVKNYASSVALDDVQKRLAVTLRGPYEGNNGRAKFIFRALKSGNVILYNDGMLAGATPNSPFKSFGDVKKSGYVELSVMKNEKVISDIVKISADNLEKEFPRIGECDKISVNKGDEIVIYIKSFKNVDENNTVFIDPVVAYTEIFDNCESVHNSLESSGKKDLNTLNGGIVLGIFAVIFIIIVIFLLAVIIKQQKSESTKND